MMGHDRWCADIRPLVWAERGQRGLCCHPYDLCTAQIARAAGVIVTDAHGRAARRAARRGRPTSRWIGYANAAIRAQVEPVLQQILRERGLVRTDRGSVPTFERSSTFFPRIAMCLSAEAISIARAPGRLDLMGGIADYSGSLVLQLPLASAACAAAQWSDDQRVHVRTTDPAARSTAQPSVACRSPICSVDTNRCAPSLASPTTALGRVRRRRDHGAAIASAA